MPFLEMNTISGKKRKRAEGAHEKPAKPKKTSKSKAEATEDQGPHILQLEAQILESRRHYNNIVTLISIASPKNGDTEATVLAAVSLCRIYCRLLVGGSLTKRKTTSEAELVIVQWLKERLNEYVDLLLEYLRSDTVEAQTTALTLLMRLVKEEVNQQGASAWEKGIFLQIVAVVLGTGRQSDSLRQEFRVKYFGNFDDVRFYTLERIPYVSSGLLSCQALLTSGGWNSKLPTTPVPEI